jgi:hypothetical protein
VRKMEVCRKVSNFRSGEKRTIVYFVTIDDLTDTSSGTQIENYGVGVSVCENGEEVFIRRITFSRAGILSLIELLAANLVTPVTASDVVYDWLCTD